MKEIKIDGEVYIREADCKAKKSYPKGDESNPFMECGRDYFIRTVTHYFTGRLVWVGDKELAFEDVAWIADTGRFNEFLEGKTVNEVEPFPKGSTVLIGRGSLIDMVERKGDLLLEVK